MKNACLLALTAVVLSPATSIAQDIATDVRKRVQAKADSLRAELDCPTDIDWPALPSSGRTTFRSDAPVRTDITIPQYAYYYHDLRGPAACLPVIIVQAQGSSLGWIAVLDPPPAAGAAFEQLFDLLGTERPAADPET